MPGLPVASWPIDLDMASEDLAFLGLDLERLAFLDQDLIAWAWNAWPSWTWILGTSSANWKPHEQFVPSSFTGFHLVRCVD